MSKFIYFNDTNNVIRIHPATKIHGVNCDMSPIKPLEERVFELPENSYAWLKEWQDGTILVSPTRDDVSEDYKPKHIGKYPIDFSFTNEESGEKIIEFCELMMSQRNIHLDMTVKRMLKTIKEQASRHLSEGDA